MVAIRIAHSHTLEMLMPPSVILILNWNGLDNTRACLESCPQGVPRYVLNNGCRPDQRYVDFDGQSTILETPRNIGFAAGMNVLIGEAIRDGAEWLLLLNNDARLADDALPKMLSHTAPNVAAVCPAIVDSVSGCIWSVGGYVDLWLGRTRSDFHGHDPGRLPSASKDVDFGSGACLLISRDVIDEIGGLDETYFAYWEETDWCWRARQRRYRIVTSPDALVTHEGGASSPASRRVHLLARNAILFMRRHAKATHWITFLPALAFWSIPSWSARALAQKPGDVLRGILQAILWHFRASPQPVIDHVTAARRHGAVRQPADTSGPA